MNFPSEFAIRTKELFGEALYHRFAQEMNRESHAFVRINKQKCGDRFRVNGQQVAWCEEGFMLPNRPSFIFDPLWHAGCYYVQEQSSMFLAVILREHVKQPVRALDLCSAPGGKATLALSVLPSGSTLQCNDPNKKRFQILEENIARWGMPNAVVTNQLPNEIRREGHRYDLILCDVPCSGEGMFRKDEDAVNGWSVEHVKHCQSVQREILTHAWSMLEDGGLMVYSTCTFNTEENEENVKWLCENFDAEVLPVKTMESWPITHSLLKDFNAPVYRFIPGSHSSNEIYGEGIFFAVLKRRGTLAAWQGVTPKQQTTEVIPQTALDYQQAITYLHGDVLRLSSELPKGLIEVTYQGVPLGLIKNIGTRANNLYPKSWRIKNTHVPNEIPQVLTLIK